MQSCDVCIIQWTDILINAQHVLVHAYSDEHYHKNSSDFTDIIILVQCDYTCALLQSQFAGLSLSTVVLNSRDWSEIV